jgi:hypothetical protein
VSCEMYHGQVVNDCAQGRKSSEELHGLRACASSVERALMRHLERLTATAYQAV